MKKKLSLIIIILVIMVSCGKKNDPVFNKKNSKILDTKLTIVL